MPLPELLTDVPTAPGIADIHLDLVLKKGKVKGESVAPGHADDIVVRAFTWGVGAGSDAVAGNSPTGRRSYRHLVVHKRLDSASTALMSAVAQNDEVRSAKLCVRKAAGGQEDFFTIHLQKARVVSVDLDADATGLPLEKVAIAFQKVDIEYRVQLASGGLGAGFSFADELG